MVKKYREATFMRILGFVYTYPCSILCDKEERSGLGSQVKYIAFWYGERVQQIRIDADASKGSSEEEAKLLDA